MSYSPEDSDTIRCHYNDCRHPVVTSPEEQVTCPECRAALCLSEMSYVGQVYVQGNWEANALRFPPMTARPSPTRRISTTAGLSAKVSGQSPPRTP